MDMSLKNPSWKMPVAQNIRLTSRAHSNRSQKCSDETSCGKDVRATVTRMRCRNLISREWKTRFATHFPRRQASSRNSFQADTQWGKPLRKTRILRHQVTCRLKAMNASACFDRFVRAEV